VDFCALMEDREVLYLYALGSLDMWGLCLCTVDALFSAWGG